MTTSMLGAPGGRAEELTVLRTIYDNGGEDFRGSVPIEQLCALLPDIPAGRLHRLLAVLQDEKYLCYRPRLPVPDVTLIQRGHDLARRTHPRLTEIKASLVQRVLDGHDAGVGGLDLVLLRSLTHAEVRLMEAALDELVDAGKVEHQHGTGFVRPTQRLLYEHGR